MISLIIGAGLIGWLINWKMGVGLFLICMYLLEKEKENVNK